MSGIEPTSAERPLPSEFEKTLEAYRALETLLADGKVRAIGVRNFMLDHLSRLLGRVTVVPAVNQIEVHPYFAQREVQDFGAEHGILTQAWSPIGGITFYRDGSHGSTLAERCACTGRPIWFLADPTDHPSVNAAKHEEPTMAVGDRAGCGLHPKGPRRKRPPGPDLPQARNQRAQPGGA